MSPAEPAGAAAFADRLIDATAEAPICIGLDPVFTRLPRQIRDEGADEARAIERFCAGVIDAAAGVAPVVKLQSACFERCGAAGVDSLIRAAQRARDAGLIVILDAKRGDIPTTNEHYAAFAFDAVGADAVTVNPYLGVEALQPFLAEQYAGRGVFALVRTTNDGAEAIQSMGAESGDTVAERVAGMVAELGADRVGERGYSDVGVVVAANRPDEAASLRARTPRQIILAPGFGAQGGNAASVRALFHERGRGAVVTASRSVIYAFEQSEGDWRDAVRTAAERFAADVRSAVRR